MCVGGARVVHNWSHAPSKMRKAFLSAVVGCWESRGWPDSVEGTSPVLSYSAIASWAAEFNNARRASSFSRGVFIWDMMIVRTSHRWVVYILIGLGNRLYMSLQLHGGQYYLIWPNESVIPNFKLAVIIERISGKIFKLKYYVQQITSQNLSTLSVRRTSFLPVPPEQSVLQMPTETGHGGESSGARRWSMIRLLSTKLRRIRLPPYGNSDPNDLLSLD